MKIDITTCGQLCHALKARAQAMPLAIVIDGVEFTGTAEIQTFATSLVLNLKSDGMAELEKPTTYPETMKSGALASDIA